MARIDSYTAITPTVDDYLLGTDSPAGGGPTRNFTVQSIIDLVDAEGSGNTNDYLDGITVESGYAADSSDTATITFSVGSQADATLNLGGAAFKAANHYAIATDLSDHIGDTSQPHSLDSIVGAGTITPAKLSGNPGNGTTGQVLLSDGSGGFSWGNDQDDNDNYYLSSVTRPSDDSNDILFTITGGTNVTTDVFNEGAFLSKADIRADVKSNHTFIASDFTFLGDLASKDKVSAADINQDAIINSKIKDNTIEESKLKITNDPVDGYVLTADGTDGSMEWVANSASNYYLDGITRGGANNRTLTFSVNGGTDRTYTFGDGAFANFGTSATSVAKGNHSHTITDISDRGALSELDTVSTSEIDNDAVTAAKLQPSTVGTDGQVLSIDGSGDLQWINSSAQSIASLRLLPTTMGDDNSGVTGKGGQILRVNSGETAVEYVNLSVEKNEFNTTNSPSAGKILAIDQNGDMLWADEGEVTLSADSISTGMIQANAVTPAKISVFENNMTSTTAGHILVSNGEVFDNVTMSGDVRIDGDGLTTIQPIGPAKISVFDDSMTTTTSGDLLVSNGVAFDNVTMAGDAQISSAGVLTIKPDVIEYGMLANEFTTRDAKIVLSSSNAEADINFKDHAVFEIDLPSDSTNVTINMDNADIGDTKVVIINGKGGSGTITISTNDIYVNGYNFVSQRLSSDDIDHTNTTVNYLQITCVNMAVTGSKFIYTVGTPQ